MNLFSNSNPKASSLGSTQSRSVVLGCLLITMGHGVFKPEAHHAQAAPSHSFAPSRSALLQTLDSRRLTSSQQAVSDVMPLEHAASLPIDPGETVELSPIFVAGPELLMSQSIPEVKNGDRGTLVRELQQRLRELGYFNGEITGFFGDITEAAVLQFQQDNGLTPDGIVGAGTTNALRQAGPRESQQPRRNNPLTLEEGDQGPAVSTLQNQLTTLGYYDGPISGYFGPLTENALIRFQNDRGLVGDGIVGNATQSAIDSALGSRSEAPSSQTNATDSASATIAIDDAPDPNDGVWEVGESGDSVVSIQQDLQALGYYDLSIDGEYGSGTEAAVVAFQAAQSLTADGKVGPVTLAALETVLNARSTPSSTSSATAASTGVSGGSSRVSTLPPSSATSSANASIAAADPAVAIETGGVSDRNVLAVQQQLQDRGYYSGELDGDVGPATRQAIQDAQRTYGLQRSDFD